MALFNSSADYSKDILVGTWKHANIPVYAVLTAAGRVAFRLHPTDDGVAEIWEGRTNNYSIKSSDIILRKEYDRETTEVSKAHIKSILMTRKAIEVDFLGDDESVRGRFSLHDFIGSAYTF